MKNCTKCKKDKNLNQFYIRNNGTHSSHCKTCISTYAKGKLLGRTEDEKLRIKEKFKKYNRENAESLKIKRKVYWDNNKEKTKRNSLSKLYNLTLEQYNQLWNDQLGLCAICHNPETSTFKGQIKQLSVDHNHETGKVRGLLCSKCNNAIGLLQDNEVTILAALFYIKNNK